MTDKAKRRYDSARRRAAAGDLRLRVLDAAKRLFAQHGIDRVTVQTIAAAADVAAPTVYALFQSKAGLLKAIMEGTFFGDDYAALAARTKTTDDPRKLLRITASISRVIFDTEKAEIGLIRGASAFSAELRQVESELDRVRYKLQERRARLLVAKYRASRALGLATVRDILWLFTGRDIYRMCVVERGWSSDKYEEWLGDTLIQLLTGSQR
jgi:AcrR family transcriptional regulator